MQMQNHHQSSAYNNNVSSSSLVSPSITFTQQLPQQHQQQAVTIQPQLSYAQISPLCEDIQYDGFNSNHSSSNHSVCGNSISCYVNLNMFNATSVAGAPASSYTTGGSNMY